MKKRNYSAILKGLLLIVMALIYNSCESVLFIELEESDKLIVVNGAINGSTDVAIQVSRTRHILDNAAVLPLDAATVRLYQGESLVQELSYMENAWFVAEGFIPAIGESYTLEVENAGYPSVTATCEIPESVPILKLDTASVTIENIDPYYYYGDQEYLQFDLTLEDPAGEDNFYLLYAEVDRSWTEYRDTTIQVIDSLWYNNQWNYFLTPTDIVISEIHRVMETPYINTTDIIMEASTSQGVLFSDQLIDGKTYSFRGQLYENQLTAADSAILDFRLLSISESYYKYLKSRQGHYDTKDNYLAVPVIVYSNVEDGTGFFGGFSTDEYTITTFIPEYQDEYWYYEY